MALHAEKRQQLHFAIAPKGTVFPGSQGWKNGNKGLTALPTGLGLNGL